MTDEENKRLRELAKDYPNLSSFVLDACWHFNGPRHLHKLEYLEQKFMLIQDLKTNLNRVAANLNELVQYTNHCMKLGLYQNNTAPEIMRLTSELINCLIIHKNKINKYEKDLKNSMRYI